MNRRSVRLFGISVALVAAATDVRAQDPRFALKLDEPSKKALSAIIDSAKVQGLPVKPLYDTVEEGQSKGAEGPRIVAVVRALAQEMAEAHRALGTVASSDELKAAASAMHAGVPAVELGKIKQQGKVRRSLTLPFTVLADIVSRGVPVSTAANAVRSMIGAGARDTDLSDFQRNVKEDIQQGAPPAAAAETRAKSASEKPAEKKPDERSIQD